MTKKKKHKYQQLPNYDIDKEALAVAGEKQRKNEEEEEEQYDDDDWDDDEKTIKHQNSMNSKSLSSVRQQNQNSKRSLSSASSMMSPSTSSSSQQGGRKNKSSSPKESHQSSASSASGSTSRSGSKSYSGSGGSSSGGSTDTSRKKRERIKEHMKKMFLSNPDKDTVPRPKVTPLEGGPTGAATAAARKIHRRRSSPVNVALRNGANADNEDVNSSLVKHWKKAEEKVILANMAPVLEAANNEQILIVQQPDNHPALVQLVQPINTNATFFTDGNCNMLNKHRQNAQMRQHSTNPFDVHRRKDVTNALAMSTYPARTTTVTPATSNRKRTVAVTNNAGLIHIEEQNAATATTIFRQKKKTT